MDFWQAYKRLQEINQRLDSEDFIDVDEIVELQKEAQKLYDFCKEKLEKLDTETD